MNGARRGRVVIAILLALLLCSVVAVPYTSWLLTSLLPALTATHEAYPSAEQAMRAMVETHYDGVTGVDIRYAGPNSFAGSQPHVWYVIAEVRAHSRADGSALGSGGCDVPGSFFVQTRQGWLHVPEGVFPQVVGVWMKLLGLAGSRAVDANGRMGAVTTDELPPGRLVAG